MTIQKKHAAGSQSYLYLAFALFYIWIAIQLPYTHDDWDWGLPNGIQMLVNATINSRYAGNFTEVVITRYPAIKSLLMGVTLFLLPFLGAHLVIKDGTNRQKRLAVPLFLAGNCLLLSIERRIWRQAVAWIAGFANFGFSALFVIVYLYQILDVFEDETPSPVSGYRCIGLFLLCTAMQLFIENLTVYMAALSLFICILGRIRQGNWNPKYICAALGCLVGAGIMFSSSLYGTLFTTGQAIDGYRQLTFTAENGLFKSLYIFVRQVIVYLMPTLWGDNTVICIAISTLLSVLVLRSDVPRIQKWKKVFLAANSLLTVYFIYNHLFPAEPNPDAIASTLVRLVTNGCFFLAVTAQVLLLFWDRKPLLWKSLLMWVSAIGVIAPLALTSESGQRLFFTSNIFLILFILYLAAALLETMEERNHQHVVFLLLAAAIGLCSFYGAKYAKIGAVTRQREAIIAQAAETDAREITLPLYPHEDYLYWPTPVDDTYLAYFKDFFGIGRNVMVHFE